MFFDHIGLPHRLNAFFSYQPKKKGRHKNYFGENLGFMIFHKSMKHLGKNWNFVGPTCTYFMPIIFIFIYLFIFKINLFIFGCVGSSFLCEGFL